MCRSQGPVSPILYRYYAYATAVAESEVDILTGENQMRRMDVVYDAGKR